MQKLIKQSSQIYKILITVLLVFIPLYPKFPLFSIVGTYVSIRLEDFLIAISFVVFLPLILSEIKNLMKNQIIRSITLFLFIGLVSLISALFITQTVSLNIGLLHLIRRAEYLLLFVCGYLYLKNYYSKAEIGYIIRVIGLVVLYIFIYGLLQRYFSFPIIITQNSEYSKGVALRWISGSHINSTFAGHYDLASYLVFVLPIFTTGFFVFKEKFLKVFFGIISLSGYWLFSSALSRISIVSFIVATSISLFLLKKYKEIIIFGLVSIILFGFSQGLRDRYLRILNVVKEKVSIVKVAYAQDVNIEDRSTSIRLNVEWPRAIRALNKNPILGTGYSSITLATDNDYLRALGEVGILGFLAFGLIFLNLGKIFYRTNIMNMELIEKIFFTSVVGGIIGILMTAIFIDIFEASKFASSFWLLIGLAISMVENNKNEQIV